MRSIQQVSGCVTTRCHSTGSTESRQHRIRDAGDAGGLNVLTQAFWYSRIPTVIHIDSETRGYSRSATS